MRNLIMLLFVLFAVPLYPQWVQQNSGVSETLNDVYCVSEDIAVVVGNAGTILKTTDGGENWIQKTSGTAYDLMKVQFVNPDTGYAVGANGTLLKTVNGGESWSSIAIGETTNLYGFSGLNENVFYISGDNGLIKKTGDGGVSFVTQNTPVSQAITDIQYLNELTGYAQGNQLLKTPDGGITWSVITDDYISSFYFLNENTGFMNSMNGGIFKTTDGGSNMSYLGFSNPYVADLFSLNENAVWGVENTAPLCGCPGGCIIKGAITNTDEYQDIKNCGLGLFEGIYFANETKGYAVGWDGFIFKNTTGNMDISEIDNKDTVRIYPNPSSDRITISFTEQPALPFYIEITDYLGKKVYSESYQPGNLTVVNVASLSKGLYFLTIVSQEKRQTQKIIIN